MTRSRPKPELTSCFREGETISRAVVTMLLGMLNAVSSVSYTTLFVAPYLASTKAFYDQEGHRLLQTAPDSIAAESQMAIPRYLQHVQTRLEEEGERCELVVGPSLKGQIIRAVEERLIGEHVSLLLTQGMPSMLDEELTEDLSRLYAFMGKVDARKQMQQAFGAYVKVRRRNMCIAV